MYGEPIPVSEPRTAAEVMANVMAVRSRLHQKACMEKRLARLARIEEHAAEAHAPREAPIIIVEEEPAAPERDIIHVATPLSTRKISEEEAIELHELSAIVGTRKAAFRHARRIIYWVCDRCGLTVQDVIGGRRQANVVRARHLAIQMICHSRKCKILTLTQIGTIFGGKDHTTILAAAAKAPSFRNRRPRLTLQARATIGCAGLALARALR